MTTVKRHPLPPNSSAQSEIRPANDDAEDMLAEVPNEDRLHRRPGFLESVGSAVVSLARYAVEKAEKLPYPVGPSIGLVEDMVVPQALSVSRFVEQCTLQVLSYVDDQLEWVLTMIDRLLKLVQEMENASKRVASKLVSAAADRVQSLGFADYAADLLINYEIVVKTKTDNALRVVLKLPGLSDFVPIMSRAGVPVAIAWLLNSSDVKDKHIGLEDDRKELKLEDVKDPVVEVAVDKFEEKQKPAPPKKVVEEISPVPDAPAGKRFYDLSKVIASLNEGDEEADELSKLIDASWCLGSPRLM